MISVVFLIVTLIVYIVLPELRNLQGWNLMCYIGCLTIYYLCMFMAISLNIGDRTLCSTVGYLAYYFGQATFFWLNIMCIEIFTKIVIKSFQTSRSSDNVKLFVAFCAYGFGIPMIITIFIYLLDHTSVGSIIEDKYRPKIGIDQERGGFQCFVQSE